MKIVENTLDLLILEDRPRFFAGFLWCMGAACLMAVITGQTDWPGEALLITPLGLGTLWIAHHFFPFQRLTFDRPNGWFTRLEARVNGRTVSTLPLSGIERAAVQAQWSDNSRMERITLVVEGEKHPLEFGFTASARGGLADDINSWLNA
ncbi:hypothetical protein PEL8287_02822 [Roseovarius litorisediminis]|uniref:DUF2244 domain-containing protein n=1 Tax=Roseovarius litorisediminis TaxID=1312363 RepID=A0A1Y5T2X1_9RHOB|nr:hypothetical protein [Roseovarius litorisediminis]SLN52949.1 hypothetical protein PEL8287_02822 [Roseovarius litorisediminis]